MRLLDLYCGAGGAAVGYHQAGFTEIVGVDIKPQKRYPFEFVQADALEYLAAHGHKFDAVHASPPCQKFTALSKMRSNPIEHPDLLTPTTKILQDWPAPYVIENIMTSPLPATVVLCGSHFGLKVQRHRKFKANFLIPAAGACNHNFPTPNGRPIGVYGSGGNRINYTEGNRYCTKAVAEDAMGIDWMTLRELTQAVPPAYTEYIGRFLINHIRHRKERR